MPRTAFERLRAGRDLTRNIALLLSSERPLEQIFLELTQSLAEHVDASTVLIALGDSQQSRALYAYQDGAGGVPDNPEIPSDSTTAKVLRSGELRIYRNAREWPNFNGLSISGKETVLPDSAIFAPIRFGGATIGVLSVQSLREDAYDKEDADLIETCALYLGARLHDERRREQTARLELLATTDPLTGLPNRRMLDGALRREIKRCARAKEPLSLALLDIDHFKIFNDTYGHVAGDACLRQVAHALGRCLQRPADLAARYGGEEFALVLPCTDETGAVAMCETVCAAIRVLNIPHEGSSLGVVTASIGVCSLIPGGQKPADLVMIADSALYRAKNAGRNRVATGAYVGDAVSASVRPSMRHNLPESRTSFVGRDEDLARIAQSLQRGRMLTIAGPGGVGKTRLALESVHQLLGAYADGVWFVDFAPIADPELVATTTAAAMGLTIGSAGDPLRFLCSELRARQALLVLDNCEHLVDAVAQLADALLGECYGVHVIVTSREPLHVAGEAVHRLGTLDDESAQALFLDRAREAGAPIDAEADRAAIASICRKFDGIALAIELAAARAVTLRAREILELVEQRVAPLRHQELRALIDWSYELLSQRERAAFRSAGIFSGSFSLHAIEEVIGSSIDDPRSAVAALVEKSMLVQQENERYRLLDSMREYAKNALDAAGETSALQVRHASYFASVAARCRQTYGREAEERWIAQYEREIDNFRAALEWAITHDPLTAASIAGDVNLLFALCGFEIEALRYAEQALQKLGDRAQQPSSTGAWLAVGWSCSRLFQTTRSHQAAQVALRLARAGGDRLAEASALFLIGNFHHRVGDLPEYALECLSASASMFHDEGYPLLEASAKGSVASALMRTDPAAARAIFEEVLQTALRLRFARQERVTYSNLGEAEFTLGNVHSAIEYARRSVDMLRGTRLELPLSNALANLASYLAVNGQASAAAEAAEEAIRIAQPFSAAAHVAIAAQALALADVHRQNPRRAAQFLGFADAVYREREAEREPTEAKVQQRLLAMLNARLDDEELERETARGRALSLADVCRLASGSGVPGG